ncbi:unnamed protein product [Ilex paraguariensis]|uniref:Uncharacterized protein n=1 Tax=Ilex paraguariensis TaxID=185542 RepID=A0ABC8UKV0_9AQUA
MRETEGQQIGSPLPQDQAVLDSSVPLSGAPLKHNVSIISPNPTIEIRPCSPSVGRVTKILLDINNQNAGESDLLTPQKKLLNSIDTVEKVVMEELRETFGSRTQDLSPQQTPQLDIATGIIEAREDGFPVMLTSARRS